MLCSKVVPYALCTSSLVGHSMPYVRAKIDVILDVQKLIKAPVDQLIDTAPFVYPIEELLLICKFFKIFVLVY